MTDTRETNAKVNLLRSLSGDLSSYLTKYELVDLSLVSNIHLFNGLNNLKYKRFIPSIIEAKKYNIFDIIRNFKDDNLSENKKEISKFINNMTTLNIVDLEGITPLFRAIMADNLEIINMFISAGDICDMNFKCENDHSDNDCPLHEAVYNNKIEIALALINAGADINACGVQNFTPLQTALIIFPDFEDITLLTKLLELGADPNITEIDGNTALNTIAIHGKGEHDNRIACLNTIIEKTLDINLSNEEGNTPVHSAIINGNLTIIKSLIDAGACINIKNNRGDTALNTAMESGNDQIIGYISTIKQNILCNLCN